MENNDGYKVGMKNKNPFSAALRFLRKSEKNLTQPKLADKLNVSQSALSKIERGGGVSEDLQQKILEYFDKKLSEFLELGESLINTGLDKETYAHQRSVYNALASLKRGYDLINENDEGIIDLHRELVSQFKYKRDALEANEVLLKIETLDRKAFLQAIAYLKDLAYDLEEKGSKDKKKLQPTSQNQSEQGKKSDTGEKRDTAAS